MPPEETTNQGIPLPDRNGSHSSDDPFTGKIRRGISLLRKLFADSTTRKCLSILILGSLFAFLIAADTGLFSGIEEWELNKGLSSYHMGELAILMVALGIAIATIIFFRYKVMREESSEGMTSGREQGPAKIWAGFQYEQLETLFRQVETAKKEWQLSLDSIRDMVVLIELDGTVHRCNRAFKEFLGLSYEEILRKDIASLLRKFGIEMTGLDLKALNARFNISGKWFGVRSYPYSDFETADLTRVVVIMLDVTSKKVTEEKVQFVWGKNVYFRLDGGKASSFQPKSGMGGLDARTPPETLTKAIN